MKRLICVLLTVIILVNPLIVKAEVTQNQNEQLENNVLAVTKLLEKLFQNSYEEKIDAIKRDIVERDYDYELTMESCNIQDNPFKTMDYVSMIAAYATVKENAKETVSINDIDFVSYQISEKVINEPIPVQIDRYEENGDGSYSLNGKKYVFEDSKIDTYKKVSEDKYEKNGEKEVTLTNRKTVYGEITFRILKAEDLLKKYHLWTEDIKKIFSERKAKINACISGTGISQSIFLNLLQKNVVSEEVLDYVTSIQDSDISQNKKILISTATSLIGSVPYEWGGKSCKPGYDDTWWTFEKNGKQKGLDCSGFVEWTYRTAGYSEETWSKMHSTSSVLSNFPTIPKNELEVGDLGLLNTGETVNHVGIYLGNDLWIHCASSQSTVVVNKFNFKIFKKVEEIDNELITPIEVIVNANSDINYTEDDVLLLAQLMSHEAKGEGLNGWIGVGEVVLNRVRSDDFENSIKGVIYQPGQFEGSEDIENERPDEKMVTTARMILNGSLKIFNNPNVLYFKNPNGDYSSDWGPFKMYRPINHLAFYLGTAQFELKEDCSENG